MKTTVHVLCLEESARDAELVKAALSKDGLACKLSHVQVRDDFMAAVRQGGWDVIISNCALPDFDGRSALAIAQEHCPEIPFILFSHSIGEEAAIEYLKAGATEYVLKDHPARLLFAVRRVLREAEAQKERKQAEKRNAKLEEQLRQAQKMEAVGRLAGGIAHDFNNVLTIIKGYSDLALGQMAPQDPQRARLQYIKDAGERAASLTRQLLAFSRRQVLESKVLDLNAIVTNLYEMLPRLIGEDIDIVSILKPGLGRMKADPGQIEQVILNLAVNARDAMPQGGKMTIETANVALDENYARDHATVQPGPHVMLAVSDTGHGMDAETSARIFEPFFTTKEIGQGTGLGLAMVYGIVKQSGGSIWVYSEPGKGTTFKIYFPRVEDALEVQEPAEDRPRILRGTETVLVAEDEEMVRNLMQTILEAQGYAVLVARNATEALSIGHRHHGSIPLLVTDVVMPGMSGRELAAQLAMVHPEAKVLYVSGYTDDAVVRHGVLNAGLAFLQKPFSAESFLFKVRDALDTPAKVYGKTQAP
ncbi:MAG: response regulator [Nitrospirae bacterium]|nr:MAG: response regulator [Nitrospirota bacterium]